MTSKAAILALLTLWGVGAAVPVPAWAEETSASKSQADADAAREGELTNRVWVKSGADQLPGVIKIFLSDGTLVQDSCWETHHLSPWQMTDAKTVIWKEDGMDIKADIVTLTANELVLSLKLKRGAVEERYAPAGVPYVSPDMLKG